MDSKLVGLLWKKESGNPNALFVDIFKIAGCAKIDVSLWDEVEDRYAKMSLHDDKKCAETAAKYKASGNEKFRANDLVAAIYFYNKSLCYAPVGSNDKSLAFANRAACFLQAKEYKQCLADIELAIKAGYPNNLMPKLEKRRADCMKLIKNATPNEGGRPELDFEADENFPSMANVLQLEYNEKYGRHVTANSDIEAGKVVLLDKAFVHLMRPHEFYNCGNCLKVWVNLIPCDHCATAMFCDQECMQADVFHKMECQELILCGHVFTQFFARSVLKAIDVLPNVADLMTFVEDAVGGDMSEIPQSLLDEKSKYRAFLKQRNSMPPEPSKRYYSQESYKLFRNLLKRKVIKEKFKTKAEQRFLMHLTIHQFLTMSYGSISSSIQNAYFGTMLMNMYFNHSCAPNIFIYQYENLALGITARPIKKGQQVFTSYLREDRDGENVRKRVFHNFKCECERCEPSKVVSKANFSGDPLYSYMLSLLHDQENNLLLRCVLIELLNKYGNDGWNENVDILVNHYSSALSEFFYRKQQ